MEIPEYRTTADGDFVVTEEVVNNYKEWGFILVRQLLDAEELTILKQTVDCDSGLQTYSAKRDDGEGGKVTVSVWDDPADDVTGVIARSEKVAGTFGKLMNDEVYHYHAKLIMKNAKTGGAHIWHQDYGYWYNNGFPFPDLGTVSIAVDDADKENGCLKIIPKSHKAGRIEHVRVGDQSGADTERVSYLEDVLGLYHVEMSAGDAIFFHANLLHRSEKNHSTRRRWAYLIAYNSRSNTPMIDHHHTRYRQLNKLPNSAIKECKLPATANGQADRHTDRLFYGKVEYEMSIPGK